MDDSTLMMGGAEQDRSIKLVKKNERNVVLTGCRDLGSRRRDVVNSGVGPHRRHASDRSWIGPITRLERKLQV